MGLKKDDVRHILTRLSLATIFVGIGIWEIVQQGTGHFIFLN